AVNYGTYIIKHPEFDWLAFSGNMSKKKDNIEVEVKTAARNRIILAPEKLWIQLDTAEVEQLAYNEKNKEITLTLVPTAEILSNNLIRFNTDSGYSLKGFEKGALGSYLIPNNVTKI